MKKIIFTISFLLYITGHLFLYLIWYFYYNFSLAAIVIIFFLFLSIFSIIVIYKTDNLVIRIIYMISVFWGAVVLNTFLLFLIIYYIDFFININNSVYLYLFLLLALFIFEFLSAQLFRIRKIKVAIKDLPDYWQEKRIIHITDVHLGPILRQKFFSRLVKEINKLKPEAVFITGDMFDGMDSNFSWFSKEAKKIQTKQGIYYSFGNHDEYLGIDKIKKILKLSQIEILDNKMIEKNNLQIIGLNSGANLEKNLKTELKKVNYNQEKASLLLFHEPSGIKIAKKMGIDLQLSGHTHAGQLFPLNLLTIISYPGRSFGLVKKGDYSLNVSSGVGTWGPPLRLFTFSEIVEITLVKK